MDIAQELDNAMRNFRDERGNVVGISQPELARISKVPQPTISRTLKGKSVPETKTLIRLARALKCTLGGYTGGEALPTSANHADGGNVTRLGAKEPEALPMPIAEIVKLAKAMRPEGQYLLLGRAQEIALAYPLPKANHSN